MIPILEYFPRHRYHDDMSFLKDVSPSGAVYDLAAYLRQKREHNWLFILAACAPPAIMIYMFQNDINIKSVPPPPTVTYFESWPADRSREESLQAIKERQAKKDAFLEKKRQGYKALGRAMGMDVEQVEREAEKIRSDARAAAAKAEAEAKAKAADNKDSSSASGNSSAVAATQSAEDTEGAVK